MGSVIMPAARPPKSLVLAYLFWFFLGVFGAHRFYLGKWFTGFIYAISFGCYGIGWCLDAVLLPFLVKRVNDRRQAEAVALEEERPRRRKVRQEYEEAIVLDAEMPRARRRVAVEEEEYEEAIILDDVPPAADWAGQRSPLWVVDFILRLGFFLVAPCFFTVTALMLELWQLLAVMAASLAVIGFIGGADVLLRRYPALAQVPFLSGIMKPLVETTEFYRRHRPFPFLYYLFYPVTAPISLFYSPAARREFTTFAKLAGGLSLVVIAPIGLSYFSVYPPHLGPEAAMINILFHAFIILVLIVLFFIPTVTTALTLNAANAKIQLRVLVIVGLVSALPMGLVYFFAMKAPVSFAGSQLLNMRLETASFREELTTETAMFFDFWRSRLQNKPGKNIVVDEKLTERYQRSIGGIVVGNEARAFKVLEWGQDQETWLAVAVWDFSSRPMPRLLLVIGPDKLYTHWADLPQEVQRRLAQTPAGPDILRWRENKLLSDMNSKK
jgi:TM2 domain-containing membrane protein YozV